MEGGSKRVFAPVCELSLQLHRMTRPALISALNGAHGCPAARSGLRQHRDPVRVPLEDQQAPTHQIVRPSPPFIPKVYIARTDGTRRNTCFWNTRRRRAVWLGAVPQLDGEGFTLAAPFLGCLFRIHDNQYVCIF